MTHRPPLAQLIRDSRIEGRKTFGVYIELQTRRRIDDAAERIEKSRALLEQLQITSLTLPSSRRVGMDSGPSPWSRPSRT